MSISSTKICDTFHGVVSFVKLKNVKNTHGVVLLLVKLQTSKLLHGCFLRFLNCTNGTKSHKVPHICSKLCTNMQQL